MKVVLPKENPNASKSVSVLLPLVEEKDTYQLDKSNSVSFDLRTVPADNDSPKYRFLIRVLQGTETPRQIIRWKQDLYKVLTGLNVTTKATRQPIMEACMRTGPLSTFHGCINTLAQQAFETRVRGEPNDAARRAAAAAGITDADFTDAHLDGAINFVLMQLLPRRALAKAKRDLRRHMRKPADMKVRTYFQALLRINDEEIPNLPPFRPAQKLTADEIADILLYGTPKSWQVEMERQGFDPMEQIDPGRIVEFMENLEAAEDHGKHSTTVQDKKKKSSKSGGKKDSSKRKPTHFCKEHGPNFTHDTDECYVLKNQKGSKDGNSGKKFSNKSWKRKSEESTNSSKKELAAMVAKATKKAVKQQLASVDKKRKSSEDSSSEDEDCFLLDMLTKSKDLDGFNYEAMENLKISDDMEVSDEVSV